MDPELLSGQPRVLITPEIIHLADEQFASFGGNLDAFRRDEQAWLKEHDQVFLEASNATFVGAVSEVGPDKATLLLVGMLFGHRLIRLAAVEYGEVLPTLPIEAIALHMRRSVADAFNKDLEDQTIGDDWTLNVYSRQPAMQERSQRFQSPYVKVGVCLALSLYTPLIS